MQNYVSNGLRALGRTAVIGAAVAALAAPVSGQKIPYADVSKGTYATRDATCYVFNESRENEPEIRVVCDTKTLTTSTLNGRLKHYAVQNPDAPVGAFIIRVEEGIEGAHLKQRYVNEQRYVGSASEEARAMKFIHDLIAKEVIKPENCVSETCK